MFIQGFWYLSGLARNCSAKQIWCLILAVSRKKNVYFCNMDVQGTG